MTEIARDGNLDRLTRAYKRLDRGQMKIRKTNLPRFVKRRPDAADRWEDVVPLCLLLGRLIGDFSPSNEPVTEVLFEDGIHCHWPSPSWPLPMLAGFDGVVSWIVSPPFGKEQGSTDSDSTNIITFDIDPCRTFSNWLRLGRCLNGPSPGSRIYLADQFSIRGSNQNACEILCEITFQSADQPMDPSVQAAGTQLKLQTDAFCHASKADVKTTAYWFNNAPRYLKPSMSSTSNSSFPFFNVSIPDVKQDVGVTASATSKACGTFNASGNASLTLLPVTKGSISLFDNAKFGEFHIDPDLRFGFGSVPNPGFKYKQGIE
ncbi:hypothetical protein BDZ45DRAFT_731573 [Acephala macrosclerotiorum]|nr:hypothetical protein BDZ45DRAFT_731573 [Acephala macrosclerotiorum]